MSPVQARSKKRKARTDVSVHLVSEATGSLARHITSVALSQFPKLDCLVHEHSLCSNAEALQKVRKKIEVDESPLVFAALTKPRLKRSFDKWCQSRSIPHFDLMGSLIEFVADQTGCNAVRDATRAHRCDDEYYQRIDAWEFTLQHDDSRRLETVGEADLILVGVSRTGKTPLSAYLGSLGFRVANVAIFPESAVPSEVVENREKAVGLTIDPKRLSTIRNRRFEVNRIGQALRKIQSDKHDYLTERSAMRDIRFAEQQYRRLGIQQLDISELTIEESAVRVMDLLGLNVPGPPTRNF